MPTLNKLLVLYSQKTALSQRSILCGCKVSCFPMSLLSLPRIIIDTALHHNSFVMILNLVAQLVKEIMVQDVRYLC